VVMSPCHTLTSVSPQRPTLRPGSRRSVTAPSGCLWPFGHFG
jgi:hypothetical protein